MSEKSEVSRANRRRAEDGPIDPRSDRPGSTGEHVLQEQLGTVDRAEGFYDAAMQHSLTDRMVSFLSDRWVGFVSGLDGGRPVTAPCIGDTGFVRILDDDHIAWPAAAMVEDHPSLVAAEGGEFLSLVTIDWWETTVGLHVNGVGRRQEATPAGVDYDGPPTDWYVLEIEEAYIHCAKHIPRLTVESETPEVSSSVGKQTTHDHLTPEVRQFIGSQVMTFLGTADSEGETDISPRIGPAGFVQIIDGDTLAWPEYRGNGVHASLGNIAERGVANLLFVDWWNTEAVLQVTGRATLHEDIEGATDLTDVDRTKQWVRLDVESVSVTRNPPLPGLSVAEFDPPWGTDDTEAKKSGFFTEG